MEIWAGVFPRCSRMLYCDPNECELDGDARDGGGCASGGLTYEDIDGETILSWVRWVVTAHWVSRPLMFMTLIDGSTCDIQLMRLP